MKRILILGLLLVGCGGDGGSIGEDSEEARLEPGQVSVSSSAPSQSTIQCEHDGVVYLCNGEDCAPDPTSEIVAVESSEEEVAESEDVLAQTTYKSISIGGSVTIIAECGSNVSFDITETTNTTTQTFSSSAESVGAS